MRGSNCHSHDRGGGGDNDGSGSGGHYDDGSSFFILFNASAIVELNFHTSKQAKETTLIDFNCQYHSACLHLRLPIGRPQRRLASSPGTEGVRLAAIGRGKEIWQYNYRERGDIAPSLRNNEQKCCVKMRWRVNATLVWRRLWSRLWWRLWRPFAPLGGLLRWACKCHRSEIGNNKQRQRRRR